MIDNFALGLTHGLLILAAWRLLSRADLDDAAAPAPDPLPPAQTGWGPQAARAHTAKADGDA